MANKTLNTRQKMVFQLPQQKPVQKTRQCAEGKAKGNNQKAKMRNQYPGRS